MLRLCESVQIKAADRLGINRNTLHNKLEEYEQADAKNSDDASAESE